MLVALPAAELRAVEAEEGVRAVCEEAAALRARVAQAEAALKSREREVERLAQVRAQCTVSHIS